MTNKKGNIVLSASRMTDMPAFYPEEIIYEVNKRLSTGLNIHTLVLWTKHPASLFKEPLNSFLIQLKERNIQLFIQLTISGLGKRIVGIDINNKPLILEPMVPDTNEALNLIPQVISLVESADRIKLRIDPVVKIKGINNQLFSSLPYFNTIIESCVPLGIHNFTFSFLEYEAYKKVNNRFARKGFEIISPTVEERNTMLKNIERLMKQHNITISACCVNGFVESSCIDGTYLEKLHPANSPANKTKPRSRPLCGCTKSIDIGGWPPRKCYSGCLYCYANPQVI